MFGNGVDRHTIMLAYALYDFLWSPSPYGERIYKLGIRLSDSDSRLETAEPEVKQVYGEIVKRHNRGYIAFERLARKAKGRLGRLVWPGTQNLPQGMPYRYFDTLGITEAIWMMT